MKDFKIALHYGAVTLRDSLHNVSLWLILAILFFWIQFYCPGVGDYLLEHGYQMNVWELYIRSLHSRSSQLLYLVGVIGVVSQVVRIHEGMAFYLARMNRRAWVWAQIMSLLVHILALNMFLLGCFAVAAKGQITFAGDWGKAALMSVRLQNDEAIGLRGVMGLTRHFLSRDPNAVGLCAFLLCLLLGMVMGLTMMIFALCRKAAFGGVCIFAVWMSEAIILYMPVFGKLQYFLPTAMGRITFTSWNYGLLSPGYCAVFLSALFLVLVYVSHRVCKRIDFIKLG